MVFWILQLQKIFNYYYLIVQARGHLLSLSRQPAPSAAQLEALESLLESVVSQFGLSPVDDLPLREDVAAEVGELLKKHLPGQSFC